MACCQCYTRLRISLAKLALIDLLGGYRKGLDALSDDITGVLTEEACREALVELLISDYRELSLGEDRTEPGSISLVEELHLLLRETLLAITLAKKKRPMVVRSLTYRFPDILIIETNGDLHAENHCWAGSHWPST